ncbi:prepilin-type N-terminal cleavage/methylation domain-containing protein [Pimelobacter simplex]|uniref:prepilin-type N-terminal cleavage/methylation domain-containing protein n=1 Tax=Nocardioides simplex TaxID=2045 RepID=UPI0019338D04|nr:prepilin-type N-terminal cleavage/methylation domain-containing protein [Pimelobacter simplex]
MLTAAGQRARNDDGFTLPELIITMAILAIIMVPLAQVVISYLINAESVRARQTESKDQQIASHYWSSDVASVGQRDPSTFAASDGVNTGSCGTAPSGGTAQISLRWTRFSFTAPSTTVAPTTTTVTYYSTPSTSTAGGTLVRKVCVNGSTVTRENTIARSLLIDGSHPFECKSGSGSFAACPSLSGSGNSGLHLRFFVKEPSGEGQEYETVLRGQRRQMS